MKKHDSMRGWFWFELHEAMARDDRIFLLTADLGYGALDAIRDDHPNRFINVGASEQVMLGMGIGLALEGQIPFCYSITSFLLYRPFEWIRNYLASEQVPVKLVGSGLDLDYANQGITHQSCDAREVLRLWPSIKTFFPELKEDVPAMFHDMCYNTKPSFIALRR